MLNKPLQCRKTGINCTDFCSCSDGEELCEDLNGDGDDGYDDGDCNGDDDEEEEEDFTDQVAWEDSESKKNIRVGHTEIFLYEHFTSLAISQ